MIIFFTVQKNLRLISEKNIQTKILIFCGRKFFLITLVDKRFNVYIEHEVQYVRWSCDVEHTCLTVRTTWFCYSKIITYTLLQHWDSILQRFSALMLQNRLIFLTLLLLCSVLVLCRRDSRLWIHLWSQHHLIVANLSLHNALVDVVPTYLCLACDNLSHKFYLWDLMVLPSDYPLYLYDTFSNVFSYVVLNFEFA